nr:MAG TPA: hypothetical protein [Caudoviricetes sp.]
MTLNGFIGSASSAFNSSMTVRTLLRRINRAFVRFHVGSCSNV